MKTSTKANWPDYLLLLRNSNYSKRKIFLSSIAFISFVFTASAQTWESVLVKSGSNGKLVYATDANKNSIPDFSYAGYKNNDKPIPQVTKIITTLSPKSGDNTSYINNAITAAASVTPDADGIRGVIFLSKGTYQINGTIKLNVSGVVLRGAGSSPDPTVGTILQAVGNTPAQRTVLTAGGGSGAGWNKTGSYQVNITDNFVQVGAREFSVASTSGLQVGDNIAIYSPCTSAWISAIGGGGTAGAANWTVGSQPLVFSRVVKEINGLKITIDAPVFNHLNKSLAQAYIYKIDRSGILTQIGLENFSIDIRNWTNQDTDENHAWEGVGMVQIEDSWATNVIAQHFGHAGFHFNTASRITLDNCKAMEPVATITPERRYNYNFEDYSTNILIKNSEANKARHAFVSNGTSTVSGVVILRCKASDNYTSAEGHRRWTMGMLFDNYTTFGNIPSDGRVLGLYSRGNYGTSHGWAAVHSVAWNCNVANGSITCQQPPTAQNYVIGGSGNLNTSVPFPQYAKGYAEGFNRTDGKNLSPQSLFDKQLSDRQTTTPPNQLPTVTLTAPANNQSFTAPSSITITADAADADGTVNKVDFYNGTTLLGTDNSAPYSFTWTGVTAGNYSITAKATDNATAVSTSSAVTITVIAVPVCQTVSSSGDDGNVAANVLDNNLATRWSASGDGQWLTFCQGSSQSVSGLQIAFYSGNTRQSIFDIQVSNDGTIWNTVSSNVHSSGSSLQLETFTLTTPQNAKYVRIVGHGNTVNAWNSYTEVKIIVGTIPVINKAPIASITSPANNDSYSAPAIITINASATDVDGTISRVDFYNGATLLGSDASAPYSFSWMNVAAGTYSFSVKARDDSGATTTSSVVVVKVNTVTANNCSGVAQYKENGGYVAGSIVQNAGKRYQCKPYPYSGWCNGAAWSYGAGTGTYWSDAWTLLGSCSGARVGQTDVTETDASPSAIAGINNSPNPFTGSTEIDVTVSEAGNVSVKIYDLKGLEITTVVDEYMNPGTYKFVYDSSVLKSNLYLLKYTSATGRIVKKIMKTE